MADFIISATMGVVAPASTPVEVVKALHEAIGAAVQSAPFTQFIADMNFVPNLSSSDDTLRLIDREDQRWSRMVRQLNLSID